MAAVTYIFSNVPGGTSIPLAELDVNFSECINNTNFTSANVAGNLTVGGASTLSGPVSVNNLTMLNGGMLTIGSNSVVPSGITGSGEMVFATSPTLNYPNLGTPASGDLINCTGYTVANLDGLGIGVRQFLENPSSGNLQSAVIGETGSGALVFNTNPVLVAPNIGTPSSGVLTNCTGYVASNISGIISITNGGTGATTADAALNNLLPSQAGNNGKVLTTNGATTSWVANASGSVSSVAVSGGTTGLTTSGSPITTSGTITLQGVLAFTNGGTGATSRQAALNALAGGVAANKFLVGDGTNITLANLTPAQIAAAGTLTNNTSGSAASAATFTSTVQNSQFNSIGVNTAPTSTPGQVNATSNFYTSGGNFIDGSGTLHPLVLATPQSMSGLYVTIGGIPSWVRRVTISLSGVSTNGSSAMQFKLGTAGGIVLTGYNGTCSGINGGSSTSASISFPYCSVGSGTVVYSTIVLTLLNPTTNLWSMFGNTTKTGGNDVWVMAGSVAISGALTTIEMSTANATDAYTAGSFNILYE